MIKVLNIAVALSTLLISNFSTIAKTENNQVKQDEFSINFEGAYSNLGESFDSKLVTSVMGCKEKCKMGVQ